MPVRTLDSAALLAVWEEGSSQSPPLRALALLSAARPGENGWAYVSIGQRDRELLQIREELFGTHIDAEAQCPTCGERLEFDFDTRDVLVPAPSRTPENLRLETDGYAISYRLPNGADMVEARDPAMLLARCVQEARIDSTAIQPADLPEAVAVAISAAMAEADPQADVKLGLVCAACGHEWQPVFDIVSFLWGEIEDWARRLLLDVHHLASAYGWSERDVVGLTPRRRRMYLEMAGAA